MVRQIVYSTFVIDYEHSWFVAGITKDFSEDNRYHIKRYHNDYVRETIVSGDGCGFSFVEGETLW